MLSPRSRREAIEEGKAELNRLYEQLNESSYDLSLRDLVENRNSLISFSGGLPVEERQQIPEGSVNSPPDLLPFSHTNRNNGYFSPPRSPVRSPARSLVKPAQISPRKISPRPTPPVSPGRRSSPLWSTKEQVKPIFPVMSFDGVNSRCSSCSVHVIFFKTRCPVCTRVYCNRCMKISPCGSKCAAFTHHPPTKRKPAISCWPFPLSNSKQSLKESSDTF